MEEKTKNPEKLSGALIASLRDIGLVNSLVPKTKVEIMYLGCVTDEMDVDEALKRDIRDNGDINIRYSKSRVREQRMGRWEVERLESSSDRAE